MTTDYYESFAERYDWMYQKDQIREEFFRAMMGSGHEKYLKLK